MDLSVLLQVRISGETYFVMRSDSQLYIKSIGSISIDQRTFFAVL